MEEQRYIQGEKGPETAHERAEIGLEGQSCTGNVMDMTLQPPVLCCFSRRLVYMWGANGVGWSQPQRAWVFEHGYWKARSIEDCSMEIEVLDIEEGNQLANGIIQDKDADQHSSELKNKNHTAIDRDYVHCSQLD